MERRPQTPRAEGTRPNRLLNSMDCGWISHSQTDVTAREPVHLHWCTCVLDALLGDVFAGAIVDFGERILVHGDRQQKPAARLDQSAEEVVLLERNRSFFPRRQQMADAHVLGVARALRIVRQLKELPIRQHLVQRNPRVEIAFIDPEMKDAVQAAHFLGLGEWRGNKGIAV